MQKRAYKYRFYPTDEQKHIFAQTFGCNRFTYNWGLATRKRAYFQEGRSLYYNDLAAMLPTLKQQYPWLADVSSVTLQQSLRHLDRAYVNFFEGRADYPTFKKKRNEQSATYASNAFQWDGTSLTLAKMQEPLNIVWHRPLPEGAKPSSVTITKDSADRYLAKDERKLAKAQRKHARKKKGSKNRAKARKKVARLHAHIADRRRDYQHKVSTRIVHENQVMCAETLAVKNMVHNPKLAKAISDVGWGEFVRQLEYKAKWYARTLVKIDRFYPSSKTCNACGYVVDCLPVDIREWLCPECAVVHDRDTNAALNILAEGLSVNACGGRVRREQVRASRAVPAEAGTAACESRSPAFSG